MTRKTGKNRYRLDLFCRFPDDPRGGLAEVLARFLGSRMLCTNVRIESIEYILWPRLHIHEARI